MARLLPLLCLLAVAAGKPHLKWARCWSDAVEEARALNLPIVVHRHGFF